MSNILFPELKVESTQSKEAKGNILFPDLVPQEEVPEWGRKNPNIWAGIQAIKETGKQVGKQLMAVPETALSLATGMTAFPIGAVGELGALAITDPETAKQFRQHLSETYTYQPKDETAKQAVESAGQVLSIPFKPAEKYKEIVTEKYGPFWGELSGLGAEALTMGLMSYAHSSVNKLMPEKLPLPSKEIKNFDWEKYSTELRKELDKTEDPVKKIETARKFVDDLNESFGIGQQVKPAKESAGRIEEEIKKETFRKSVEDLTPELSGKSAEDLVMEFKRQLGLAEEMPKIQQEIIPELAEEVSKKMPEPEMKLEFYEGAENTPQLGLSKRTIKEVIQDINASLGEKGGIGGKLTPEQEAAKQRLSQDLGYLNSQAKKSGKSLYDYLILEGVHPDVAKALAGELPKYAGSINLQRQNIPDNYKAFELELSQARPKKVQSWDETGKLSAGITQDYQRAAKVLEKAKKGDALTAVEIDAVRQINVNAIDRLKEIAQSGNEKQFAQSFTNYKNDIFGSVSDASSEAGRALNIHKKEVSANRMAKAFDELKRGLNERELKEFKEINMENPLEVQRFIDRLGDPKIMDYIYEYWYNSILSGIPTHEVNLISNTTWGAFQVPHRALTAGIDSMISKLPGRQREYFFQELMPMMTGMAKGFPKGAAGYAEMMRTGHVKGYESKWGREIGEATTSAFERSPYKVLREASPAITMPLRELQAMDVWANAIAFDAQLGALAKRRSLQKFPKDTVKQQLLEKKLLKNPTKEMLDESAKYAQYATFNSEPGKIANGIMTIREATPGGRFIVPFVRTVGNLLKRGIEMTPGVGLIEPSVKAIMKRPTGQHLSEVIAKQIEGAILALYILNKVGKGEITGPAPIEPARRDAFSRQGKIPWGMTLGDNIYQYRRFEPFNTPIASVAMAYDAIVNAKDEDTAVDIFFKVADSLVDNWIDSSYADGVQKMLNKRGDRSQIAAQLLSSLVPYSGFWRSINRAIETATEGDNTAKARDMRGITRAFAQVIPGLSSKVPAKLNVWGDEIVIPGGMLRQWLPYKYSEVSDDPVELELEKLKVYPGLPKQTVTIRNKKVSLPDDFYRAYAIDLGHQMKSRLDEIITLNESYQQLPDERKIRYLDKHLTKIRQRVLHRAKIAYLKSQKQSTETLPVEEE